jgi:hypothetical protein
VFLYLISLLCATNMAFLPRRTNGLIQLTYSIIIAYALFLTVIQADRRLIAGLFLGFSLVILIGCLFEGPAGLRPVSDAVRKVLYSKGVYENDLRDVLFYNRVRPKFFASEPASVTGPSAHAACRRGRPCRRLEAELLEPGTSRGVETDQPVLAPWLASPSCW